MSKVVLLRGLGRESGHWDPDFLAELKKNHEVIAVDYPGVGKFAAEEFPLNKKLLLENLHRQIGGIKNYILVAVSLGGMIALEWIQYYTGEVRGLILINTSAADLSPFHQRLRPLAMLTLFKAAWYLNSGKAESLIVPMVANNKEKQQSTINIWTKLALKRPMRFKNTLAQLIMASRFKSPTAPLPVPLLVLVGMGDRLVHPRCSELIAEKYSISPLKHPWGGHDLMIDDSKWVIDQIENFSTQFDKS